MWRKVQESFSKPLSLRFAKLRLQIATQPHPEIWAHRHPRSLMSYDKIFTKENKFIEWVHHKQVWLVHIPLELLRTRGKRIEWEGFAGWKNRWLSYICIHVINYSVEGRFHHPPPLPLHPFQKYSPYLFSPLLTPRGEKGAMQVRGEGAGVRKKD